VSKLYLRHGATWRGVGFQGEEGPGGPEDPDDPTEPTPGTVTHGSQLSALNTGPIGLGLTYGQLTPGSGIVTSSHGQVIQNLDIVGSRIRVNHNNVTIRGCRIQGAPTAMPIYPGNGVYGLLIEYCELLMDPVNGGNLDGVFGIYDTPVNQGYNTIRRCNIHHMTDGAKLAGGWVFEENYVHPEVQWPAAHNDGIQSTRSSPSPSPSIIVRRNKFICGDDFGNAGCWFSTVNGNQYDLLIEKNWIQASYNTVGVKLQGNHPDATGAFLGTATIIDNKIVHGWNDGPEGDFAFDAAGTIVRSGNRRVDVNGNDLGSAD
jgi:hypothetical protein